jgi:crossover junction endodeoxyribonuclease RuvC
MRILGIDPGLSGAFAMLDTKDRTFLYVSDVPVVTITTTTKKTRNEINLAALAADIGALAPDHVVIERVGAMPGQGVTSMFRFGYAAGAIAGIVSALNFPLSFVEPNQWKRRLAVPKSPDDASRLIVTRLFPQHHHLFRRKLDHNRADAVLIAVDAIPRLTNV